MSRLPPKIVQYFLVVGFLIPCLLSALLYLGNVQAEGPWGWVVLVSWPAIGFYMSAYGHGEAAALFAFLVSAITNSLVYGLGWSLVSFCYRLVFRRTT